MLGVINKVKRILKNVVEVEEIDDIHWDINNIREINKSEFFDEEWYLKVYKDVAQNWQGSAIEHYMEYGWKEGRNPGPLFDAQKYAAEYCNGDYIDINPLLHYEVVGKKSGIIPPPTNYNLIKESRYFDSEWYKKEYLSEETQWQGDPILHFINVGYKRGCNPSIYFDVIRYSNQYDCNGTNPLLSYELEGKIKGIIPPVTDYVIENESIALDKNDIKMAVKVNGGFGTLLVRMNFLYCLNEYIDNSRLKIYAYGHRNSEMNDAVFKDQDSIYRYYPEIKWSNIHKEEFDAVIILDTFPKIVSFDKDIKKKDKKLYELLMSWEEFQNNLENKLYYTAIKVSKPNVYQRLINEGKTILNSADINKALDIGTEYRLDVKIQKDEEKVLRAFAITRPFITIQRGMNPKVKSEEGPKLWPVRYYEKLIELLHRYYPQYLLVQLGESEERCKLLEGIDISLIGKTDWDDVKILLKRATLHIDGECGMVHLRKALNGGASVVLFGPTPIDFFGYEGNINISADVCPHWCVELTDDWEYHCPNMATNICMTEIKPEYVMEQINNYFENEMVIPDYENKVLPEDIIEHIDKEYYDNYLKNDTIFEYELVKEKVGNLLAHVYDGKKWDYIPLEETPAYRFLEGEEYVYSEYIDMREEKLENQVHSVERFRSLIHSIETDGLDFSKYIVIDAFNNIRDGQHRAAIFMKKYGKEAELEALRIYRCI